MHLGGTGGVVMSALLLHFHCYLDQHQYEFSLPIPVVALALSNEDTYPLASNVSFSSNDPATWKNLTKTQRLNCP